MALAWTTHANSAGLAWVMFDEPLGEGMLA